VDKGGEKKIVDKGAKPPLRKVFSSSVVLVFCCYLSLLDIYLVWTPEEVLEMNQIDKKE